RDFHVTGVQTCALPIFGVKNIVLTFRDCDTDEEYGPYSHELADDTQPTYRLCSYENTVLPGGYVERTKSNNQIDLNVVRLLCIRSEERRVGKEWRPGGW